MSFLAAALRVMYLPMLWRTLLVLGILGLGAALYTHQFKFLLFALLAAFPLNVVVVVVFMIFFAKF